jgi:Ca-activated chloride channel family protein
MMRLEVFTEVVHDSVYLLVAISASPPDAANQRSPVNLALIIDRSSSMRGPRIAQAIRAARLVLARLETRDRLTVIAFDANAQVVFGPEPVTGEARARLDAALAALDTGIGTNLAASIKLGADKIRAGYVRGGLSRLVLLTDGQPSVGLTDPDRLAALVAEEAQHGVTLSAMGIGHHFEDALLAELARRGGGGFYYLASAAEIPAAFGRELGGLFSIAAIEAELKLVPDESVASAELLHRLPSRPMEDGLAVEVGQIAAGEPRHLLFRLRLEPGAGARHLAKLRLTYRGASGSAGDAVIAGVELPRMPLDPTSHRVTLERLLVATASVIDLAWARRGAGDRDQVLADLATVRRQVTTARAGADAIGAELDALLADLSAAEQAIRSSAAEREDIRRRLRERSQLTLLGQSSLVRFPVGDEE